MTAATRGRPAKPPVSLDLSPERWALVAETIRAAEPYPQKVAGLLRRTYGVTYYKARKAGQSVADINQTCLIAACEAAARFDFGRGVKFQTYALHHMRGAVQKSYDRNTKRGEFFAGLVRGDWPYKGGSTDFWRVYAPAAHSPDPAEEIDAADRDARVRAVLDRLPPRMGEVVRLRFGIGGPALTLREVAERVGVSKERVRQIEAKALELCLDLLTGAGA